MASKQYKMDQTDDKYKIIITRQSDGGGFIRVQAPLPDGFGMSVGSEFTAPFDSSSVAGVLQKFKIPSMAAGGISRRIGVATTKYYSNPEPTEISFELEFHAEYSARHEVVEPVVALMMMALGEGLTLGDISSTVDKVRGSIDSLISMVTGDEDIDEPDNSTNTSDIINDALGIGTHDGEAVINSASAFLRLIKAPKTVSVRFGNVYEINNLWVSSVTPSFSNVVDAQGFPLSATCSVTMIMGQDPLAPDVAKMFGAR